MVPCVGGGASNISDDSPLLLTLNVRVCGDREFGVVKLLYPDNFISLEAATWDDFRTVVV